MKKLITLMFLGCFATTMFGQLSITTNFPNPAPGATATVDFEVSGFTDIVSAQFTLNYDPAVLQFSSISFTNPMFTGLSPAAFGAPPNTTPGVITFSWFDSSLSGVTVADGTLMFSIDFVAIGADGTNSAISFGNTPTPTEFSDNNFQTLPPGDITLVPGNVPVGMGGGGPSNDPLGTAFNCPSGATGDNVCVDVSVTDFDVIQGFQYTVEYDPSVLQFTGVAGFNLVDLGAGNFGDISPGILTVSWNDVSSGMGVTVADGTVIYQICFNVIGAGGTSSVIEFTNNPTPSEATQVGSNGANIGLDGTPCTFTTSGTGGTALSIAAGSTTGQPGSTVCVPYTVTNFNDIVSMQYVMNYDNTILQFNSVMNINPAITGLSTSSFNNNNPGTINFSWFDNTIQGVTVPNGTVAYEICYDVIGSLGQSSPLSYSGLIEASQNQMGSTNTVPLTTLPGSVNVVGLPGANFTVDAAEINSDGATNVCVPFTVLNFSQIVSMQFDITYDPNHLMFTAPGGLNLNGLQNNNFNQTMPGNIRLSWVTPNIASGETLPDGTAIFELCFDKLDVTGTSSVISFNMNAVNEISDVNGEVTLKDFLDGSVTCTAGNDPLDISSTPPVVTQIDCAGNTNGAIDVTTDGGAGTVTYTWTGPNGFSESTEDISGLAPGTYNLTATDGIDTETLMVTINPAPSAITATNTVTDESGLNLNDGAINLTPTGGTPGYTFAWSGPNSFVGTTEDISGLAPGDYTVVITDANMCTMTVGPITVGAFNAPPPVIDGADITDACFGEMTGSILLTVSSGTPPYTYQWSNGQTTNPATNLAGAMTYTVTVSDANMLTAIGSYTVNQPTTALDCSVANITDAMGGNTGVIDLIPSGGTAPYTFMWSNNQTTEDISSLAAGTYNVTVTDANGCQQFCSHTVNQGDPLEIDETQSTVTDAACAGINSGSINTVITGGCMPYTFAWSNGQTTQNIAALIAGTYILTVTDCSGATDQATFTVGEPASAVGVLVTTFSDESALNANDGTITVAASGGAGGYTYAWAPNTDDTTPTVSGLTGGTYCVTVTDATGVCTATTCQTINTVVPNPLVLTFTTSNPACNGGTGGIGVTVTGGTMPYMYIWDPVLFEGPNVSAPAGTYSLTVTDAVGVQAFGNATLTEPTAILINGIPTSSSGSDGMIDVTTSGGSPSYSWTWTGPAGFTATTEDISGLAPGQYCVDVLDANGCTETNCFDVGSTANPPVLTISGTNLNCNGDNSGSINLSIAGGVGIPMVAWTPDLGATLNPVGLAAGTYTVTVTDQNNDSDIATITLTEPSVIVTTGSTTPETNGNSNGAIDIDVTGGCGSFTYVWNNGATTQDISGLPAGQYIVNITDCDGCTATGIYDVINTDISNGAPVVTESNVIPADCNDEGGAITVAVAPGNPPYVYAWSNGAPSSPTITGLGAGSYDVTVTDALGLVDILTGIVVGADMNGVSVPLAGVTTICESEDLMDGQVNITPVGGVLPYTFLWSNGETTEDITGLIANDYRVTITDASGCIFVSEDYTVCFDGGQISVSDTVVDPSCTGDTDGLIDLTINTAGSYSFLWSTGDQTSSITGLAAGMYSVTITDDNNNDNVVFTETFELIDPEPIAIVIDEVQHQGCPPGPGAIFISVSGGLEPFYNYLWSTGATTQDLNPAPVGFHQVTITDDNGCFVISPNIEVTNDPPCSIGEIITATTCPSDCDGTIDITVTGGMPGYTYLWSGPNNFTSMSEDIIGLCPGAYTVVITDADGLTNSHTYVVGSGNGPEISGTTVPSSGNDGSIDVSVTNGLPPYSFLWAPNGETTEDIENLPPGDYTLTVTDSNGCTDVETFTIVTTGSTCIAADINNVDCFGNMNGSIDITVCVDLTPPLAFAWTGPNMFSETTEDVTGLEPGQYTVVITDANNMTDQSTYTISEGSNISVNANATNETASNANDGTATANPNGGVGPYSFIWSNGGTTSTITGLAPGDYTVTITDQNGCTEDQTVTVDAFIDGPTINVGIAEITGVSCAGECNGTAFADIAQSVNTTPPYTYLWSNGQTTQTATGLCNNILYMVTVTDANGIQGIGSITNQVVDITAEHLVADLGNGTFDIILDVTGGSLPYTFVWDASVNSDGPEANVPEGEYNVLIMDADGCIFQIDGIIAGDTDCLDFRPVITPNDDGLNDNFIITCIERFPGNELEIYSRWGELMWINQGDYENDWEGVDMSGRLLPQGGYFFVFRYDEENAATGEVERRQIRGAITLLR